ncbi:uncharacterized protein F5891DRAFT_160108 [Suillus fuscotomentosus]|uniref:NACHT domain-containing protein n=1 Tax=Suillus fuscotomentosus TaxID=1912939 RepID=A0AAD4ECC7_9AGAM|nr:uncharacterized protein F5891DRAFT_160108 [Suillus fuscotomentosus]KAG1902343.1 hypothetical protein F5891DRAFT_160108 [Suillus fuscotomentosus]
MDFTHPSSSSGSWNCLCNVVEYSGIFDSESRQPHSRCMENTRVALRRSITQVLDQRDRTNIWLNGLAGVGKTSIAFTIAEEMKSAKRLAATFFFSHKHAQKAPTIIPTIAYQLALAFPRIRGDIVKAIENDDSLLSDGKSHADQMRELVIRPLQTLKFREESYVIIIDALDECFSQEEAARLLALLTDTLSGPSLPLIHLIFTSRPEVHIRAAMPSGVHEILLTTRDKDTIQDVRFFLRTSLDKTRTIRPAVFGQPPIPWPSEDEFETLVFKAGGLFVYAAMAMNFISTAGHHPQERLELLLRKKSTVGADIDQLYREIIEASKDPLAHCRMLASIINLRHPLSLAELQELFYVDKRSLAMMLEAFSPVILNDGAGHVEIYHASLRDFMNDPSRSKQYHIDAPHTHEHLACCCLDFITRQGSVRTHAILVSPLPYPYPHQMWDIHLRSAYPSSKLRNLLSRFTNESLQHWVQTSSSNLTLLESIQGARRTCLSLKWIRSPSDIVVAWRLHKGSKKFAKRY